MRALEIAVFILRSVEFIVFALTNLVGLLLGLALGLAVFLFIRWHVKNYVD
jgi:hypothetical protein